MSMDRFVKARSISGDSSKSRASTPSPSSSNSRPRTPLSPPTPSSVSLSDEEMERDESFGEDEAQTQKEEEGVKELQEMLTGLDKYWQYHSFSKKEPAKKPGSFIFYGKAKCVQQGCKSIGSYNTLSRSTLKIHYDKMHKGVAYDLPAAISGVTKRGRPKAGDPSSSFKKPRQMSMNEALQKAGQTTSRPTEEEYREVWLK